MTCQGRAVGPTRVHITIELVGAETHQLSTVALACHTWSPRSWLAGCGPGADLMLLSCGTWQEEEESAPPLVAQPPKAKGIWAEDTKLQCRDRVPAWGAERPALERSLEVPRPAGPGQVRKWPVSLRPASRCSEPTVGLGVSGLGVKQRDTRGFIWKGAHTTGNEMSDVCRPLKVPL